MFERSKALEASERSIAASMFTNGGGGVTDAGSGERRKVLWELPRREGNELSNTHPKSLVGSDESMP
jgi:hypothetical protein